MNTTPFHRIEFFGLPGVGKTYLADLLLKAHPQIEPYILTNRPANWYERLHDYPFSVSFSAYMSQARKEPEYQQILTRFRRIARRQPYIQKNRQCIMIECGLLQPTIEALMLHQNLPTFEQWKTIFNKVICEQHHYIYIHDHVTTITNRERTRERPRFTFSQEKLLERYTNTAAIIDKLKPLISYSEFHRASYPNDQNLISEIYTLSKNILSLPL